MVPTEEAVPSEEGLPSREVIPGEGDDIQGDGTLGRAWYLEEMVPSGEAGPWRGLSPDLGLIGT